MERETDNQKVSVEDILRLALKEVRDGTVGQQPNAKPISAVMCIIVEEEDGRHTMTGYRCGLTRLEEVGYLDLFKAQQIRKWQEMS